MKLHELPESVNAPPDDPDVAEKRRLAALRDLGLLDTPPEQGFDDLTALAARACGAPVALVSLVDEQRLWFKSCHGARPGPTPRRGSPCAQTIRHDDLLELPDTLAAGFDPALLALPHGEIARFYAGVPLRSPDGHKIGVLCVMDRRARRLDEGQRDALRRLGRQAQAAIAARRAGAQLLDLSLQLERRARLRALHARASRLIAEAEDAQPMLRAICDALVEHGGMALAFVSRPDAHGVFGFPASAGRTGFLRGLELRADPRHSDAQTPLGTTWHAAEAVFLGADEPTPELRAWCERGRRHGLQAGATVPILRAGRVWAALCVFHVEEQAFDADARAVLAELAFDMSRGLDRIDASRREQELSALQRTLLDNTLAGILVVRERRIVSANRQCARMLGYRDPAELVGLSTQGLYADDDEFQRIGRLYSELRRGGSVHAMDVRVRRRDGSEVLFDAAAGIAGSRTSRSTVWTFVDVTERARLQHQLRHDALHDILSDLPNRRALDEYLPRTLARARRRGKVVAVGVLDLDDFKPVNDTYGHEAGDALLRELARRLGRSMRKSDMLARLGGDEFVVVLDDLDEATLQTQLQRLATRLHRAVEAPFALGGERQAHIGMTLGLATFPRDGADADVLLRHADAALYQLKARKRDRTTWWQYGVLAQAAGVAADETSDDAGEPDAYGAESARMLHEYAAVVRGAVAAFVRSVYTGSGAYGGFAAALRHFDSAELAGLERRHAEHLEALFSARTTRGEVDARAKQLGRAQALVGIQPAQLIEPTGSLRQMLAQACASSGLASGPRHRLLRAVEQRLQDDLQGQLRAAHRTMGAYFKVLNHDACAPATLWRDALRGLVEPIGALPGILACVVLRPNARGRFEVEAAAGPQAERLSSAMAAADYAVHLDPQEPARKGLVSEAWRTRQLQTSAHLERDPRVATWHEVFQAAGGRSAVAVPIIAEHGRCALVVWLLGAYPNQFDAAWVTPFIRSLQYRAAQAWNSTRAAASHVLSQDVAQDWRDRLLDGGLDMHVQPVVDLLTGECLRVEALARLRLAGGRIVAPAAFLPILGEQELDWLFRSGLEQVCARLQAWDREGLRVDAAINLPPSCLLNPACAQWVQAALELHGIESSRLTIELLETQGIEFEAQNLALRSLQALGVKLAMDDLGAGYSSLQRLAQLPFDTIKIDQGLLLNLRKDPLQTLSLVRAIVRLAAELGRTLVVEGVEDRGAIEAAVQCGARYAQGYGIARPMPAEQFAAWLRDFRLRPGAEEVHTSLGMLARCRRLEPRDAGDTPPRTGDAVPHFLRVREPQHAGLADWYAQLSARMAAAGASRAWIDWLVREVALEAGPAEPPPPGRAPAAPRAPRRQANC